MVKKSGMYGVLYCDEYDIIGRFSCSNCKYWYADKYTKKGKPYKTGWGECRNLTVNNNLTVTTGWMTTKSNFGCNRFKPL